MSEDREEEEVSWSKAGLRPTIFVFFHVSIIIPILTIPFNPYGFEVLIVWALTDLLLQRYSLTLHAALMRCRLWMRGGIRKSISRRQYQKLKKGTK